MLKKLFLFLKELFKKNNVVSPPQEIPIVKIAKEEIYSQLYATAFSEIGQKELRGEENGRILQYHDSTTLGADEDEIAWCASFLNWTLLQVWMKYLPERMDKNSYKVPKPVKDKMLETFYLRGKDYFPPEIYFSPNTLPTFSAAAKSFENWGFPLSTPVKGCIVVVSRPPNRDINRHVAIFSKINSFGNVELLGGNQGDAVCIKAFDRKNVVCFRGFFPERK